jgi:hypothetical protein
MSKQNSVLLTCFNHGWLDKAYFDGSGWHQPLSAEDRFLVAQFFYEDFLRWQHRQQRLVSAYDGVHVDTSRGSSALYSLGEERFRRALHKLPKSIFSVLYKIVLEDRDIPAPAQTGVREKQYFYEEIKRLLCRGIDTISPLYLPLL